MACLRSSGMGTPRSPAFSTMDRSSLQLKAMHTPSRRYDVPMVRSSRTATSTSSSVTHFLTSPRQPILLESLPLSDLGDFPQTAVAAPVI